MEQKDLAEKKEESKDEQSLPASGAPSALLYCLLFLFCFEILLRTSYVHLPNLMQKMRFTSTPLLTLNPAAAHRKSEFISQHHNEIEILFIGSSTTQDGFSPELIKARLTGFPSDKLIYNRAVNAYTLFTNFLWNQNSVEEIRDIPIVVLGLNACNYKEHSLQISWADLYRDQLLAGDSVSDLFTLLSEYRAQRNMNLDIYARALLQFFSKTYHYGFPIGRDFKYYSQWTGFTDIDNLGLTDLGWNQRPVVPAKDYTYWGLDNQGVLMPTRRFAIRDRERNFPDNGFHIYKPLEKIMSQFSEKTRFIFAILPEHPTHIEAYGLHEQKAFSETIQRFVEAHPRATLFDAMNLQTYSPADFSDKHHLQREGAVKLSESFSQFFNAQFVK